MRFIDPHLHTFIIEDKMLQWLTMAGMEAAVVPCPHVLPGTSTADTMLRLWRRLLGFEVKTAQTLGFEAYFALSVPFYGLDSEAIEECLEQMPEYLKHERVVAIGEIGLDVGIEDEEKLFNITPSLI